MPAPGINAAVNSLFDLQYETFCAEDKIYDFRVQNPRRLCYKITYDVDHDVDHTLPKFQSICSTIHQVLSRKTMKDTRLQFYKIMDAAMLFHYRLRL